MATALKSDSGPPFPRLWSWWWSRLSHAFPLDDSASPALCPGLGPDVACRRRALEAVEKAHCIRWMVALRENPGGAGLGGLGLLPRCGWGLGWALAG